MNKLKQKSSNAAASIFNMLFFALFLLNFFIFSMESSADLKNKKQITFQKVMQITDKDESYYFKYPVQICEDAKENLYILDNSRILKFSKAGKYEGNLVTIGRGPGEVNSISNILLIEQGEKIIIHNSRPNRIIWKDAWGKLLKEFPINEEIMMDFIYYCNGTYYFFRQGNPEMKQGTGIRDVDNYLCTVTSDRGKIKDIHSFPIKRYVAVNGSSMGTLGIIGLGEFKYAIGDNRYVFFSHTPEYNIKCYDLHQKKSIYEIKVNYERKKMPEKLRKIINDQAGSLYINGKRFQAPIPEYFYDIQQLLIYGSHLWVVTSTFDEKKGNRIDIYNFKGENIDSVYTFLPGRTDRYSFRCFIHGQHLYSIETNDEGNESIVKYKILNWGNKAWNGSCQ
jgi:hypothetical protein